MRSTLLIMSSEKDVKLSIFGADEKDAATSSDAATSLLGKVDSLPTANPERVATSLTSAEGVKKIWPGELHVPVYRPSRFGGGASPLASGREQRVQFRDTR